MNEAAAREVVLIRAVETTDAARVIWTDADRAWAGRAAAEVVGATAPAGVFLARRAALAVERLSVHHPSLPRVLRAFAWRPGVGVVFVLVAFIMGVASDQIGAPGRVNILAPPLLALIAWNLGVYIVLLAKLIVGLVDGQRDELGPLRGMVAWLGSAAPGVTARALRADTPGIDPSVTAGASAATVASAITAATTTFSAEWARSAAPLLSARISRILHVAAAALALGALTGLYVRGLVFEYRAGWESTFLAADTVARVLSVALAPGAWLTGFGIPGADQLEAIRAPSGVGQNAAPWIHLYAATVALLVLLPRLVLGALAWFAERRGVRRFPLPLADPYYARLLRGFSEGPPRVHVVPYSFEVPSASIAGLHAVMARTFGARTEVTLSPAVAYGDEHELAQGVVPRVPPSVLVGLFSLAATPESENHGAFIAALARSVTPGTQLAALIDEASFRARFVGQTARVDERRAAWRQTLAGHALTPIFVDLTKPDLLAAEVALNAPPPRT